VIHLSSTIHPPNSSPKKIVILGGMRRLTSLRP